MAALAAEIGKIMSFSSEVKNELARLTIEKKCCMLAEIAGFLRVSASIKLAGGGRFSIVASTENAAIARHYKTLIKEYFGSIAELGVGDSQVPGRAGSHNRYYLIISPDEKSSQILRETGMMLVREGNDYFSDGIYQPIVKSKCDKKAYIRGIFLGCGTITDPRKSYHLEFVIDSERTASDLRKLIGSFVDLSANVSKRKGDSIVYMKRAAYISDMLGIMGADDAMLEFENIKIGKELHGEAQRRTNCDNANVDRVLSASEEQLRWIRLLEEAGALDKMEVPLRELAILRRDNPAASLTDLGEMLTPPIKKPGVNKRFAKIRQLAEQLEGEQS